jgi:hypothetical protein
VLSEPIAHSSCETLVKGQRRSGKRSLQRVVVLERVPRMRELNELGRARRIVVDEFYQQFEVEELRAGGAIQGTNTTVICREVEVRSTV